jgi:hypothetical protein
MGAFWNPENGLFSMARENPLKIRFIIFGDFSLAVKNKPLLFSAVREKLPKIKNLLFLAVFPSHRK